MPLEKPMPVRAPSLYLLFGIVAGFWVSGHFTAPGSLLLGLALVGSIVGLLASSGRGILWTCCFLVAATLSAWSYADWRLPDKPLQSEIDLPIREASLRFEVTQVMQAKSAYGTASGLGRILEADPTSRLAPGDPIYFQLELPEDHAFELLRGSGIRALGLIDAIDPATAGNSFDSYLVDIGVFHEFTRVREFEQVKAPSPFEYFCLKMNKRFESYLRLGSPEAGGLERIYIAMLLGQKAELTTEQSDRFRASGTMHFFAISGLHIGVIATVLAQFLLLVRVPRKVSPFIGLPLLYLYVEITGGAPSAVRAFLMALFFWLSFALCRQRSPLAALAASAIFVLIINPAQLWSLGFQLSYTVVLSILLYGLPLYERASEKFAPFAYLPKTNWSLGQRFYARALDAFLLVFAVSFSAWLASAPLSAAFFGYFSPSAILLNVLLVNLVAVAIITGVVALSLALVGLSFIAEFINHAAWLTIALMDRLVSASTQVPYSVLQTADLSRGAAYTVLLAYFTMLFVIQRKDSRFAQHRLPFMLPSFIIIGGLLFALV